LCRQISDAIAIDIEYRLKNNHNLMDEEIKSDIRNKLTTPIVVLEKISKGERVPEKIAALALKSLKDAICLLDRE